jgi:hypothetical protein
VGVVLGALREGAGTEGIVGDGGEGSEVDGITQKTFKTIQILLLTKSITIYRMTKIKDKK